MTRWLAALVSRHGSYLAVGVGSVRTEVLVVDMRDRVCCVGAGHPSYVAWRCRF
jgi:hypothetical protein